MILFLLFLLYSASCYINRTLTNIQFKGFIYPYAVFVLQSPNSSNQLLFSSVANGEIFQLTDQDKMYLKRYNHLQSFRFPPSNSNPAEIIIKQNLFVIKSINAQVSWSITYLKRPHLHKYYLVNNIMKEQQSYVSFFNRRQQTITLHKSYLFDACELWRSWVFVRLQEHGDQFVIFIKKQPGHQVAKKYSFFKIYFTSGDIFKIILQKHPSLMVLQFMLVSQRQICLFHINKDLSLEFQYCSEKQNYIVEIISISASKIAVLYSEKVSSSVFKFEVQLVQDNLTHCQMNLPEPRNGSYIINKMIHNRLVFCDVEGCHSYSFNCQNINSVQQTIPKITNIFYERIEHEYLQYIYSLLVIQTQNQTLTFSQCDNPSLLTQNALCRKQVTQSTKWITNKYSVLNCYECSRTPRCYFQDDVCKYFPQKQIQFFQQSIYRDKYKFLEQYSRYEAGITSRCQNQLKCVLQTKSYNSFINIQQDDTSLVQSSCEVLIPLNMSSQFLIQFPNQAKFDLQICSNDYTQTLFTCLLQSIPSNKTVGIKTFAVNYILLLFVAKSGGPNQNQFTITDLNQQNLHNATLIFSEIVIGFILITTFLIFYAILKNRILNRLALWGWIQFKPTGKYPLSDVQLQLKIKYYNTQGYIKQTQQLNIELSKQTVEQCCFCLSQLNDRSKLFEIYCRHQFHKSCLSQWFQLQPNSDRCPMCKRLFLPIEVQLFNVADHEFHRKISTSSISARSEDIMLV